VSAWRRLLEIQRKEETDAVLPVEAAHADELIVSLRAAMPPITPWLQSCNQIAAICGRRACFKCCALRLVRAFSPLLLRVACCGNWWVRRARKSLRRIRSLFKLKLLVGKVALFVALMEHLSNVERVEHFFSIGVCAGVLQ
jgi:hypothetical protein